MKKFGKMIKGILKIWFFYLIVCLAILPLYHKRADEENRECERVLNMAGQERILNIANKIVYLKDGKVDKYEDKDLILPLLLSNPQGTCKVLSDKAEE